MTEDTGSPFEDLLGENLPALRAFARLRTGQRVQQREELEDIVQTVCREALGQAEGFEYSGEHQFRNWLFTLVKRKLAERDRFMSADKRDVGREQAVRDTPESGPVATQLLDAYATFTTPSRHAAANEELRRIEGAFAELPEDQQEIISLVRIAGLSHTEAAAIMERSEEASRQLLSRALIRLTVILKRGSG